jgi:N6-adenosine-specific RNA methylase IME4
MSLISDIRNDGYVCTVGVGTARFPPLPNRRFEVIVPDPPWHFETWSEKGQGRSASRHYPTLTATQIATLPVQDIAARNCVLLLWCPGWAIEQAITTVIPAWRFKFKTVAGWAKPDGLGLGKWFRESEEYLLLATHGKPRAPLTKDRPSSCFILPRTARHSAKPVEVLMAIERMFPGRSKIELFCRGRARPGWTGWGNEAEEVGP